MNKSPRRSVLLLLSFLLPAAVMAGVFALSGLAPFGTRTLGVMDMSHQYISFLYSLRDVLRGRADLLYLPSMCLGGNMLGVFAYYLVSPLNWAVCLLPRESIFAAVSLLYFIRIGLCGLTMCVYTGSRHGWSPRCLIASFAYAFMAYMVAYSFNYLWQDCVALLPIVALGIARLREKSGMPWLYILSLAAALALNFYIGYILCIFAVLFFLYELFSVPRAERGEAKPVLLRFILGSLAAGALAAVLLLPAFFALRSGKAEFSLSSLTWELRFTLPELLSKLFPAAFRYEEIMPEGLPQIYCGTVTVCLAVLYFANRRIPLRRRLMTGGLMLVFVLSFAVAALDLVWHGLNTPNWYNYRYSFLLSFLMAAAADRELACCREGTRPIHLLWPVAVVAAASLLTFAGREYAHATWRCALAAGGVTVLLCAALFSCLRRSEGNKRLLAALGACVLLLQAGEMSANAAISLRSLTAQSTDSAAYAQYAAAKAEAFRAMEAMETGHEFFRAESPVAYSQNRCEPMLFGYDGLSHYGSTISQTSLDFLDSVGFDRCDDIWAQYGPGVTAAADALLGVRYLVTDTLDKPYRAVGEAGGYILAANDNALPIGWTADTSFRTPVGGENSFDRLNALYAAAAPELGEEVFTAAAISEPETENFRREGDSFTRIDAGPGTISWTVTARADGPLYAELEIPDYPGVMLFADGVMRTWYATTQSNGTVYLGDCARGDSVTVKLQSAADVTVASAAFATENDAALARYAAALKTGGCPLTKISSSHYIGSFTAPEKDGLLVLTLPYDPSWHITLDGKPVTAGEVQGCLTALAVTPGSHTVELRYIPAGLIPGAAISVLALAALITIDRRNRKRR